MEEDRAQRAPHDIHDGDNRERILREWWARNYSRQPWIEDPLDRTNYLMSEIQELRDLVAQERADGGRSLPPGQECQAPENQR